MNFKKSVTALGQGFIERILQFAVSKLKAYKSNDLIPDGEPIHGGAPQKGVEDPSSQAFDEDWMNDGALFAVTLSSNCTKQSWFHHPNHIKKNRLRRAVRRMDRGIQREVLGPRFHTPQKRNQRWEGLFVVEKAYGNIHLHGVIKANNCSVHYARDIIRRHWVRNMKSGTSTVEKIYDLGEWMDYMLKEYRRRGVTSLNGDDIVFITGTPEH